MSLIGPNVKADIAGNILTITIDMSVDLGPSESGKSKMCAKTEGAVTLENGMKLNLQMYKAIPKTQRK